MSEEEGERGFIAIRFAENGGEPFCIWCKCAVVYTVKRRRRDKDTGEIKTRTLFTCKDCLRQFSPTSQTIFASRKLEYRDILFAVGLFANGAKGLSALHLSRDLKVQYRTAFVLAHKLREAMSALQTATLSGQVEIDGAYFGGVVRKSNRRANQRDRRRLEHQSGKRKCITIMRERGGKSRPFVCSEKDAAGLASSVIEPGSLLYADEAKSYDSLHALFQIERIDHSKEYSREGGVSTNQAESFFSRMRRAERGVHHHIAGPYLGAYAGEMSWREDNRRLSNGEQFLTIAAAGLHHPVSRQWKGYWQRRNAA
jgi:hypothetical protein